MINEIISIWLYYLDKNTSSLRVTQKEATVCKDKTLAVKGNSCKAGGVHLWFFKPNEINSAKALTKYPYRLCLTERNDELAVQLFNKHLDKMTNFWNSTIENISTQGVEVRH